MKLKNYLNILLLLFALSSYGQPAKTKILEHKLKFLKENLMLDKEKSEAFDKLYRNYDKKRTGLNQRFRKEVVGKIKNGTLNELSEKEQMQIINTKLIIDKEKYELNQRFTKDLLSILPPVKVIMYYKLERQFNRKLIKKLKGRKRP
jgi:hypothetical protein